jgi:hypothetical protein
LERQRQGRLRNFLEVPNHFTTERRKALFSFQESNMKTFTLALFALCLGFTGAALAQVAVDPSSVDLKQLAHPFAYFAVSSLIGMVGHAVKKWVRGETASTPVEWFVSDHGKNSVAAVTAAIGTAGTAALTHQLDGMTAIQLMYAGFASGVMFDSGLNKGAKPSMFE